MYNIYMYIFYTARVHINMYICIYQQVYECIRLEHTRFLFHSHTYADARSKKAKLYSALI